MVQPQRRRSGGPGPVLVLVLLLVLGVIAALALMTPPYRPQPVEQPVPDAKLPL